MFQRAVGLGVALAAIGGGAALATTAPPTSEPSAEPFVVEHAENFTLTYDGDHKVLTVG